MAFHKSNQFDLFSLYWPMRARRGQPQRAAGGGAWWSWQATCPIRAQLALHRVTRYVTVDNKSLRLHLSARELPTQKQNVRHVQRLRCSGSADILTKISRFSFTGKPTDPMLRDQRDSRVSLSEKNIYARATYKPFLAVFIYLYSVWWIIKCN